ncbi:MAG: hypothetical protein QOE38_1854 [Thermoleophilaceae bacterium]|nr:hypothetical protein [Thermoleophilaceae bacterium]
MFYDAEPGEGNRLTVSSGLNADGYTDITVSDPAAIIRADGSCSSIDDHTAHCVASRSSLQFAEVKLGDGNDQLHVGSSGYDPSVRTFGGPGDDLLTGGRAPDELYGGGGHDRLSGGGGNDVLSDGDLSGAPGDAGPGPDFVDGGAGQDLLTYEQRTGGVTVDLGSAAPAGEHGEGDEIHNLEDLAGGSGADRLTGTAGVNELRGHGGADALIALGGNDVVEGGSGADRIEAGNGDDILRPGGGIDSFSCGLGNDSVTYPVAGEVIGRCEEVVFDNLGDGPPLDPGLSLELLRFPPHPVATSSRLVRFAIGCPTSDDGSPRRSCEGTLTLREAFGRRRLLGRAPTGEARRHSGVRVRINALGRRLIRRRQGVFTTASLRGRKSDARPLPSVAWTIRLRA